VQRSAEDQILVEGGDVVRDDQPALAQQWLEPGFKACREAVEIPRHPPRIEAGTGAIYLGRP
jgi:hypothetical protein